MTRRVTAGLCSQTASPIKILMKPIRLKTTAVAGRLLSIDALRGIAALGVVYYHAVQQAGPWVPNNLFKWPVRLIQFVSSFGYTGVFLFFVISGFCIHLQWAKTNAAGENAQINFGAFWKRRIRRLYPPYLIAFALYLILTALTSGLKIGNYLAYDVVMHLLMLHNLDPKTVYSINGVFWTLAVEEQLYLAYFLLLFLRMRFGWTKTLLVCLLARPGWYLLSSLIQHKTGIRLPVSEAAAVHWFTWALGAIAVESVFGQIKLPAWSRNIWLGASLLVAGCGIALLLPSLHNLAIHDTTWLFLHPVWGLAFFIIVNRAVASERSWSGRMSAPRPIVAFAGIGIFSYSLYLTHELIVMQSWRFDFWAPMTLVNTLLAVVPATVIFAWLFFRFCEKPYMRKRSSQVTDKRPMRDEVFTSTITQAEA